MADLTEHVPEVIEEDHQGRTLYRARCRCGFVVPLLLAGNPETAIDVAYERPHPWAPRPVEA